jgi:hypothetical protein
MQFIEVNPHLQLMNSTHNHYETQYLTATFVKYVAKLVNFLFRRFTMNIQHKINEYLSPPTTNKKP